MTQSVICLLVVAWLQLLTVGVCHLTCLCPHWMAAGFQLTHLTASHGLLPWLTETRSHIMAERQSVGQSSLGIKPHLKPKTRFLFYCHIQQICECGVALSDKETGLSFTGVIACNACHLYLQFYMEAFNIVSHKQSSCLWIQHSYSFKCDFSVYIYMHNIYKASVSLGLAQQNKPRLM
jgi:hypothetical protein